VRDPLSTWFPQRTPQPSARVRIFCFPYAGGSAGVYRPWGPLLAPDTEVCAFELPGRSTRFTESPFRRAGEYAEAVLPLVAKLSDKPFALFGHSMGAVIAFELAKRLKREGTRAPSLLILSARGPRDKDGPPIHALPMDELVEALRDYEGTPAEVLDNQELMELLTPTLRADFAVAETHTFDGEQVACPILAMGGLEDERVPVDSLEAWEEKTTGPFELKMFAGGHFFFQPSPDEVLALIRARLLERCQPT
jgi:medium-chain acyl-[acyl-carrier-protein] hydrolase